jgi:hypothetical protein
MATFRQPRDRVLTYGIHGVAGALGRWASS